MARAKFLYLRIPNSNSTIEKKNGRFHRGNPIGCIASRYEGDTLFYSISVANPRDDFSKPLAREIAQGRLESCVYENRFAVVNARRENKNIQTTHDIMVHVRDNESLSTRARNAARLWCDDYAKHRKLESK